MNFMSKKFHGLMKTHLYSDQEKKELPRSLSASEGSHLRTHVALKRLLRLYDLKFGPTLGTDATRMSGCDVIDASFHEKGNLQGF